MSVKIINVLKHSPAYNKGIRKDYILEKVNSHEINDILDYEFYCKSSSLNVVFSTPDGKKKIVKIIKDEDEDIGLEFDSYLMDKQHSCCNKCVFCFIDQMPPNMRETLYFKDDDSRLSFFFGNYITLTNLSEHDVERIIEMHISPVNVSVHTMNPELRVKMMKNKNAGKSLEIISRLAKAGIKLNTQLVLCPGINDGDELTYSLNQLAALYPSVQSIAAVPVGLTKFRENLFPLSLYTPQQAKEVIEQVNSFGDEFKKKHGTRLVYAADEFYIKAGMRMPDEDYYEDYPQIENGVGLWKSLETEFYDALESCTQKKPEFSCVSVATGEAAYPLIKQLCLSAEKAFPEIKIIPYEIKNDFFGRSVTVAGLITAQDLMAQLKGKQLGEKLVIPSVMLKSDEDVFLDDYTLSEVSERLNVKIEAADNSGEDLLYKLIS